MIEIYLENVQLIGEYQFTLPTHGIVQFTGNNSNGKSVLVKILSRIVLQKLKYDDKRLPLINDAADNAKFSMSYRGKLLIVNIDKQVNSTWYCLVREDGERIFRGVNEGGIDEILKEFGFVIIGKNSFCLQICETYGPMPFVNTDDITNGEVVKIVTTDPTQEEFLDNYKVTFSDAKSRLKSLNNELSTTERMLEMNPIVDTTGYSKAVKEANEVFKKHSYMKPLSLITLEPFPVITFDRRPISLLEHIPFLKQRKPINTLFSLDAQMNDLHKLAQGKCPTCGKRLLNNNGGLV